MVRVAVILALVTSHLACSDDDVGYPCQAYATPEAQRSVDGFTILTPANDCFERVCVQAASQGQRSGMCSRACDTDGDCPGPNEACPTGYSCRVAVEVGSLHCCTLCLCDRFVTSTFVSQSCAARRNPACPR